MSARSWSALASLLAAAAATGFFLLRGDGAGPATADGDEPPQRPAAAVAAQPRPFATDAERNDWTMRTLEAALQSESRDVEWADTIEKALDDLPAQGKVPGLLAMSATCRSTMCRVLVTMNGGGPSSLSRLLVMPGLSSGGFHGLDPDDPEKLRLYVGRNGTNLQEHPYLERALALR